MSDSPLPTSNFLRSDTGFRGVVAAFALNGLLFGAWASRVPAFKASFDLSHGTLGLLLLALAGGAIISFPLAGVLSEKWGADRLTIRCSFVYAPALVVLAFAPTPLILAFALLVFGALHGAMDVSMNGWGAQVETRIRRSTMSVFHAMFSLGAGIGAGSGYAALRLGLQPSWHFIIVAFLGGVLAITVMIRAVGAGVLVTKGEKKPLVAWPSPTLALVGLIAFAVSMGEGAMADWSAVFLRIAAGASEAQAALGYAVFSIAMVLTRLSGGIAVERFGPSKTTRASAVTALGGVMLAIVGQTVSTVLMGFALMGVGYAIVMPLVFSRAARDPDVAPGPALASVATLGYGGMLIGPPVIGFVAQITGMRMSFLVLAALTLLAVFLAPRLRAPNQG
jgi:MFS family permease